MKITKFFLMAALALAFAACSNDDQDILAPEQPQKAEGIPFTATISIGESAATRALSESGSDINATWAVDEEVALIHNGVNDKMTVSAVSGGVATITGTITGYPSGGDAVTIIYPATAADGATGNVKSDVLVAQDGTLTGTGGTSIAEKYDLRIGSGTLNASGTSLSGTVSLTNQNAIFKLTLKNIDGMAGVSATSVVISDQTGVVTTVTPASGYDKVMYVAVPITATTLKFLVTGSDKMYFNMASGLSLASKYYQSTIKLATVGDVILSTGKWAKAGTSGAVAMIAYLGSNTDHATYKNGLAIALADESASMIWSEAKSTCEGKTAVPGAAWVLPSKNQWKKMFEANSGSDTVYTGLNTAISSAGGTGLKVGDVYWSSTDDNSGIYRVQLNDSYASWYPSGTNSNLVRACLAF